MQRSRRNIEVNSRQNPGCKHVNQLACKLQAANTRVEFPLNPSIALDACPDRNMSPANYNNKHCQEGRGETVASHMLEPDTLKQK
jgi:hypothetical protein